MTFTANYSSPYARLVANVIETGTPGDECWEGADTVCKWGYSRLNFRIRGVGHRKLSAHIATWVAAQLGDADLVDLWWAYVEFRASGLELDHTCVNPRCRRPDHLEPVTHQENVQRSFERRRVLPDVEVEPHEVEF